MNLLPLIAGSLRYYWRTHLGVVLGAALGAMVLTGALLVGDSVQATLRRQSLERVGKIENALLGGDRFFRAKLGNETGAAPIVLIRGSVSRTDAKARVNQAQVIGVEARFWKLSRAGGDRATPLATINERLAAQLGIQAGETVIVRVEKPSAFSKDAPLSGSEEETVALRVKVESIDRGEGFGNFSLQGNQVPPFNIFVPIEVLQERLGLPGGANVLLSQDNLKGEVEKHWQLADASLQLRPLEHGAGTELRTGRVFLDAPVQEAVPPGVGALTYLVNEIRSGDKATPYSMGTAVDTAAAGLLKTPLGDEEAAITQWEADDLRIGPGGKLTLRYYVMGERRQLEERGQDFTVREVIPMNHPRLDSSWMPDFPGLSDKKNCRDWEPGFAMDLSKIRDRDEQYWDQYHGTPKVFISLAAGQKLWANRWGNLTSIRYPRAIPEAEFTARLRAQLPPEKLGLTFLSVSGHAQQALQAPIDFGQLFLGFSFFLLAAAAVLTGLLFVFSLEQRNVEAGLLLALGWPPRQVRRLLLAEGAVLALLGSVLGMAGAIGYTAVVLWGLATVWKGAVGSVHFSFSATPSSLAIGLIASLLVAFLSMWLASRRQLRHSARELLASAGTFEMERPGRPAGRSWSRWVGVACLLGAVAIAATGGHSGDAFFSAGSLLLLAGLAFGLAWLQHRARASSPKFSLPELGARNAARRRGRSMATIAILASGVFMVVAVDAFRQAPPGAAQVRESGTGGFGLVGESALPVYEDLNSAKGRETFGLDPKKLAGVSAVPFRVKDGDDASCLNLNRAVQPRLLAVKPSDLASRKAFRFSAGGPSWDLLAGAGEPIPAVVDETTLEWALQKKIGDTLDYRDERGTVFQVRLAATLAGSILQGSVLIAEDRFIQKFPSQGGYRFFLFDAPPESSAAAAELSRGLADRGFEVTPAVRRLADFQAVENTYLSIFQALGGLGLLLGSIGMAILVARHVLERRSEFGLLEAVGFRRGQLRQLVFIEHRWLIFGGLAIGAASALLAVWPSLIRRSGGFPAVEMAILLAALTLGALFWTWLATRLALQRNQVPALRAE